jgi:hypothetical protein
VHWYNCWRAPQHRPAPMGSFLTRQKPAMGLGTPRVSSDSDSGGVWGGEPAGRCATNPREAAHSAPGLLHLHRAKGAHPDGPAMRERRGRLRPTRGQRGQAPGARWGSKSFWLFFTRCGHSHGRAGRQSRGLRRSRVRGRSMGKRPRRTGGGLGQGGDGGAVRARTGFGVVDRSALDPASPGAPPAQSKE